MTAASPRVSTADLQAMDLLLLFLRREQLAPCLCSLGSARALLPLPWTHLDIMENIYFATPQKSIPTLWPPKAQGLTGCPTQPVLPPTEEQCRSHPPPEHCPWDPNSRRQGEPLENKPGVYPCGFALLPSKMRQEVLFTHCSTMAKSRAKQTSGNYSWSITLWDNPWGQQTLPPFDLPPSPLQTPGYTFLLTPEIHHHLHPSHPHPAVSKHPSPGATDSNKLTNTPDIE